MQWPLVRVVERRFSIHEVISAAKQKRLLEAFGSGTAAVVAPIKALLYKCASDSDLVLWLNTLTFFLSFAAAKK